MYPRLWSTALALLAFASARAADEKEIRWLIAYDGKTLPAAPTWTAQGQPVAKVTEAGLSLSDASAEGSGFFRATWKPEPDTEVIVEAELRVIKTTGVTASKPESRGVWPWRDGVPVSLFVSDGRHQEGLMFQIDRVCTWTDRFLISDPTSFHTYRLVIRGTQMSVFVDGKLEVPGENAFWKPADSPEAFVQFGSTCKVALGEAEWRSVRLGLRKAAPKAAAPAPVKITVGEPWPVLRPDLKRKPTRPYLSNLGQGRLLMSQAQGPDALFEEYGVAVSTDEGKTWTPVEGLDFTQYAPLPALRLKDGTALGVSRWTWIQPDGSYLARVVNWDALLAKHTMAETRLHLPEEYRPLKVPFTVERHIFENPDGSLLVAGYSKTGPSTPEGLRCGRRFSHLLRSTDRGQTWNHFAVMGPGGEPAVARTGGGRMTALLRTGPFRPFVQVFSEDDGRTWSPPALIEVGSVCPDLVPMSNGLLACSYGRPASCLMFSADGGRTWFSHHVISAKTGFNYTGIVEISPGRLLYMHDGGGLQAQYIDVQR